MRATVVDRDLVWPVGVGASEVGVVMGCDPWTTPLQLYRRKVGLQAVAEDRPAMRVGRELEGPVVDLARRRLPEPVRRNRRTFAGTSPGLFATPDGFVGRDRLLEAKVVGRRAPGWDDDEDGDELPCHVRLQVQAQLAVTGRDAAYVAALLGTELRLVLVERDPTTIALLEGEVARFTRDHLLARVEPDPLSWDERWEELLDRSRPGAGEALAGTNAQLLADELLELRAEAGRREDRERELRLELLAELQALGVARLVGTGWTATLAERKGSTDWRNLVAGLELPKALLDQLIAAHTPASSPTFTFRGSRS